MPGLLDLLRGRLPRRQDIEATLPAIGNIAKGAQSEIQRRFGTKEKTLQETEKIKSPILRTGARLATEMFMSEQGFLSPKFNEVTDKITRQGYSSLSKEEKDLYVSGLQDFTFGAISAPESKAGGVIKAAETLPGFRKLKGVENLIESQRNKLKVGGGIFSTIRFKEAKDLDTFIRDTAEGIGDEIKKSRRGKVSWEQTLKDSEEVTIAQILDRKRGQAVSDSYIAAASSHVKGLTDEIAQMTEQARQLELKGKSSDALRNGIARRVALYKATLAQTFGASAEAGRSLNAHKILAQSLMEPREQLIKNVLQEAADYKNIDKVVDDLMKFAPEDKVGMIKYLAQVSPSTPIEKIESIFYNNILSGTSTHLANSLGNLGRTIWHVSTKPLRVASDVVTSAIRGEPREEFLRELGPEVIGGLKGFRDGIRRAFFALKTGIRTADVEKLRVPKQPLKGVLGAAYSTPSRLLIAEDELFRGINRSIEINRLAVSKSIQEGLKGKELYQRAAELVNAPTQDMIAKADTLADELLFTKLSKELQAAGQSRSFVGMNLPLLGRVEPLKFVAPFIQTPVNVVKFALEASPIGGVSTLSQLKSLPKDEVNRRIASAILGSTLLAGLATYVSEGRLTGAAPKNQKDKDAWFAKGFQPYSVKIGNTWVQYNRLPEPLATHLTTIGIYYDIFKNSGDIPTSEKVGKLVAGVVSGMTDRTYLSGISDLMNALEEPDRYGRRFFQNLATSIGVPFKSLMGTIARAQDRVIREPETLTEAFKATIPGLSREVPAKESEFEPSGEATKKSPGFEEFLPIKTTQEVENPEAEKRLEQSKKITEGKSLVLELLRGSKIYKGATEDEKESLEKGVVLSYSNKVRADKDFSIMEYLKSQKTVEVPGRSRGQKRTRKRSRG